MTIHFELIPVLALAAGIGILVAPRSMKYILAVYLIAVGVLGLVQ